MADIEQAVLPESKYVIIESVKLNIKCRTCGRTYGKTLLPDAVTGEFAIGKGWEVCTSCTQERLDAERGL